MERKAKCSTEEKVKAVEDYLKLIYVQNTE